MVHSVNRVDICQKRHQNMDLLKILSVDGNAIYFL